MVMVRTTGAASRDALAPGLDALHFRDAAPRNFGGGVWALTGERHDVGVDLGDLAADERAVLVTTVTSVPAGNVLDGFGARAGGQATASSRLRDCGELVLSTLSPDAL